MLDLVENTQLNVDAVLVVFPDFIGDEIQNFRIVRLKQVLSEYVRTRVGRRYGLTILVIVVFQVSAKPDYKLDIVAAVVPLAMHEHAKIRVIDQI